MSLMITEMISENKHTLNPNPVLESDPKDLLSSETDNSTYVASGARQKIIKNWCQGDQIPLIKIGNNRSLNPIHRKKESPKKNKRAITQLNDEELHSYIKRVDDTIETVVKSSDEDADQSTATSLNSSDVSLGTESLTFNSIDVKTEAVNGVNVNNCTNHLNLNHNQKKQLITKKRPKAQKSKIDQGVKRNRSDSNVFYERLSSPPLPPIASGLSEFANNCVKSEDTSHIVIKDLNINNNVISGFNDSQLNIITEQDNLFENHQNDSEIKPKRGRKSNLKIKTSSLFKSNPYLNSFQQFLSQKSEPSLSDNTSNSSVSVIQKYRKVPKSETQIMAKKRVYRLRKIKPSNVVIKRTRKRPLIIKNLTESNPFKDFVSKKFPLIKEGVPFIQDKSCKDLNKDYESSDLNYCLDCNDKKGNSQTCRFVQYRALIKNGDKLSVYAFAEEGNATHDDCKIWLPVEHCKSLDRKDAIYLLTFVGQQFCKIYKEETQIALPDELVTWKKPVKGIRELCDICETTIFNTHYLCPKCGLAVCIDCFGRREQRELQSQPLGHTYNTRKNHDQFGWILCSQKQSHCLTDFHLAVFITRAVFGSINKVYHNIRNEERIMGLCDCNQIRPELNSDIRDMCASIDLKSIYPDVPRYWLGNDTLLVLTNARYMDNLKLFQLNWLRGYPVIIERVNQFLDNELWTPSSFNKHYGKDTSRLVNCMNGNIISKQPMSHFWDGFEDVEQRLVDETGDEMILKLKDWPPNTEFRDKLPLWFDNLMDALPLPEYTRYNGKRNLASRLPEFFVRPDLGPKMYCAYGSVLHPEKGTTNLHLDMSDAVNVMIYVGVAQRNKEPLYTHLSEANETLLKGGCNQQMMSRANSAELKVGALWHIWKAEDAEKIREFLNKVAKERNMRVEANNDPIHDQSWYLDETLRTRLEIEYNVKGLAIAQCLGDAILVPAGAPHQVQNIHSCIKVAGEFVSPENVAHCLAMTQQFRNLSKRHNNHEDKLQIKNIIVHTIKDTLSVLLSSGTKCFSMPSPPRLVSHRPPPKLVDNINEEVSEFQSIDVIKQMSCNSLDASLESNSLNVENNSKSNHSLNTISNESQNCRNISISREYSVEHKTIESVKLVPNVCSEKQLTKLELNELESSKRAQRIDLPVPPPLVIPTHCANSTSENTLCSPPVLTPYNYSDESTSVAVQTKGCPLNSCQTHITNA